MSPRGSPTRSERLSCFWRISPVHGKVPQCVSSFDMVFLRQPAGLTVGGFGGWFFVDFNPQNAANAVMAKAFTEATKASSIAAFKMVIPVKEGYWSRTNSISQRLWNCEGVETVKDIAVARRHYRAPKVRELEASSFWDLLATTVGIIQLQVSGDVSSLYRSYAELEYHFSNRLSMPLLVSSPIPKYKVAMLHGRQDWTITEQIYRAAYELDIEVYVIDQENHWIQSGPYTKYRADFISVDMTPDAELPSRVVKALNQYPLAMDGLVSFSDVYLIAAAHAAQALGLWTNGPNLYETCRDKYLTRMVDAPENFDCMRVEGYNGLVERLNSMAPEKSLNYPLIVKPCSGYGSEGVARVDNEEELLAATAAANKTDYGRGDLVTIETYVDGPEVDANFVLWHGQPLFWEISDGFPPEAESGASTTNPNFMETDMFLPTALPQHEQTAIREAMLRVLSKLGCRNGVFHMEARVRNSMMEYRVLDGYVDLFDKACVPEAEPEVILIENNCRPPNSACCLATQSTYGVDYYALHWLAAVSDGVRVKALTTPFLSGPQHHCDEVMIPVVKGGKFANQDAVGHFMRKYPTLHANIFHADSYFRTGDMVPDPSSGILTWIAYFIVVSKKSRREVLDLAQIIRNNFTYELEA